MVNRFGEKGFLGVFSVVALIALAWLITSYRAAPYFVLWGSPIWTHDLAIAIMPVAFILLIASLSPNNPTMVSADLERIRIDNLGFFAVTRHPMLWSFTLWASLHIAANGDAGSLIFFGSFLLLAFFGTFAIDAKTRKSNPAGWGKLAHITSNLPFAALFGHRNTLSPKAAMWPLASGLTVYLLILFLHSWLFGVSPFP